MSAAAVTENGSGGRRSGDNPSPITKLDCRLYFL